MKRYIMLIMLIACAHNASAMSRFTPYAQQLRQRMSSGWQNVRQSPIGTILLGQSALGLTAYGLNKKLQEQAEWEKLYSINPQQAAVLADYEKTLDTDAMRGKANYDVLMGNPLFHKKFYEVQDKAWSRDEINKARDVTNTAVVPYGWLAYNKYSPYQNLRRTSRFIVDNNLAIRNRTLDQLETLIKDVETNGVARSNYITYTTKDLPELYESYSYLKSATPGLFNYIANQ